MIKISVFYPWSEDAQFDMDYYLNEHMPMVEAKLGAACKGIMVDQGIAGAQPGSSPAFIAVSHLFAESSEEFFAALAPHHADIDADNANYTNVEPILQISETKRSS